MGLSPAVAAVRQGVRSALAGLPPGDLVLAACSGGADSLALAAALAFEAPRAGVRAGAVTVDHGLQAGSAARAAAVAATLEDLGLFPVQVETVSVGSTGGPEAAARAARYAALDAVAHETGAVAVLLGHTRDDQAETVLLGLARGSGARSLSGMAPVAGRYRRPLLDIPREMTAEACRVEGLPAWDDPHNTDPAYARARVRHRVLPVLEAELGGQGERTGRIAEALARTARLLRDDADALDAWAAQAYAHAHRPGVGAVRIDADELARLPSAVRRRVLRAAALDAGAPATDLTARHVTTVDALVTAWRGQGPLHLPGPTSCRRAGAVVEFRRADATP